MRGAATVYAAARSPQYPLRRAPGKRYLVDQFGVPFRAFCDSPWSVVTTISAADCATYLATRTSQGFNAAHINLIDNQFNWGATYGTTPGANVNGDLPFLK